ncbi:hypothetical protein Bca101_100306 [Brassica carinata]
MSPYLIRCNRANLVNLLSTGVHHNSTTKNTKSSNEQHFSISLTVSVTAALPLPPQSSFWRTPAHSPSGLEFSPATAPPHSATAGFPSLQELPYSSPLLRDGQAGSELAPAAATIPPVAAAASPETATAF